MEQHFHTTNTKTDHWSMRRFVVVVINMNERVVLIIEVQNVWALDDVITEVVSVVIVDLNEIRNIIIASSKSNDKLILVVELIVNRLEIESLHQVCKLADNTVVILGNHRGGHDDKWWRLYHETDYISQHHHWSNDKSTMVKWQIHEAKRPRVWNIEYVTNPWNTHHRCEKAPRLKECL